jgi:hypothetical protein
MGYLPSDRPTTNVHALKIVVEPLLGRHQVYGIFRLPIEMCPPGHPLILTVRHAGKYCENAGSDGLIQKFAGLEAPLGTTCRDITSGRAQLCG